MLSLNLCSINNKMKLFFLCCQFHSFRNIINVRNWPMRINVKGKTSEKSEETQMKGHTNKFKFQAQAETKMDNKTKPWDQAKEVDNSLLIKKSVFSECDNIIVNFYYLLIYSLKHGQIYNLSHLFQPCLLTAKSSLKWLFALFTLIFIIILIIMIL